MSTRGCIIKLKREKCEIDYIHHGLDLVIELFYGASGDITSGDIQDLIVKEIEVCPDHLDITDKNMIDRLFYHDTSIIEMDAEIYLFCEDKGHYLDLTLKWTNYKYDQKISSTLI
jgi:Mg2+/Co2+ transporter CorC